MTLQADAIAYETVSIPLAADTAAHEATGVTLEATKDVIKAAFEQIRPQFPLEGKFVRVFENGPNSIVLTSLNGQLSVDIVPTE